MVLPPVLAANVIGQRWRGGAAAGSSQRRDADARSGERRDHHWVWREECRSGGGQRPLRRREDDAGCVGEQRGWGREEGWGERVVRGKKKVIFYLAVDPTLVPR